MSHMQYMPGDQRLVDQLVYELKSKGIFDQFRKECIADVDTRPAYQNLRQRVESSVSVFLSRQKWRPDLNKNQLREKLRKHILDGNYLEQGVERIVDQVVNPKVASCFIPQVEDLVYNYLGIPRKKTEVAETSNGTENLLPTDLEAVSPGSVHDEKKDEPMDLDEDKKDDDTQMSGVIDLTSRDSELDDKQLPEGIKLEDIPRPENSPPEIDVQKIKLPKDPPPDSLPEGIKLENIPRPPEIEVGKIKLPPPMKIPLPDEIPPMKQEFYKHEDSDDDDSSSDSSLIRNMSPLTPVRTFDDENSCDAQQPFDDSKEESKVSTFKFTIENKQEKKDLCYQFDSQVNFNTPGYDDSSNSNNLQIDYESDANNKLQTEKENDGEDKKDKDRKSHKSSRHSRDRHSSSSKRSESKHSSSKDKTPKKEDDRKKRDDRKDSRDSSKHRSSSSSHKSSKDSKSRSSSSKHTKSDDKKKSSSSSRDKSKDKTRSDKDKDKKRKDEKKKDKKDTDDHYSLSGRGNNGRRSTDRDSNDGNSSSSKSSNVQSSLKSEAKNGKSSKSENTSSSEGTGTSPSDKEVVTTEAKTSKPVRVDSQLKVPIADPKVKITPEVVLKKPKFAANFEEAKRLMKMRKFLDEEQRRMNQEAALLLEFHANVRPSMSQAYSSISGPELEFACAKDVNVETNEMIEAFVNNTTNESVNQFEEATEEDSFEVTVESEDISENEDQKSMYNENVQSNDKLQYFTQEELFDALQKKANYLDFLKRYTVNKSKLFLVNCTKYEESIFREISDQEIVCYTKNGTFKPVKDIVLDTEVSIPVKESMFSPKSECSFELSSDYDTKIEEMVKNTSRQQIMEIILGGAMDESPSKMPSIDYCNESNLESDSDSCKRKFGEIDSVDNNNRDVLTPNKLRKICDADQITSTTDEDELSQGIAVTASVQRSKYLGKARRVGLPKPKRMNLPNSPSSDKSVENYEQNSTPINGRIKAVREKVQRYDTSDLYKPKLHFLSKRNNVS